MNETFIAKILESNRITIPNDIAKVLGLKPGQRIKLTIVRAYK